MNKNDLRAQRTFHKINKNFKILMGKVGYKKLNVAMVTEKANMNRSTFYSHFKDKRHLYEYHLGLIVDSFGFLATGEFLNAEALTEQQEQELIYNFEKSLIDLSENSDFILAMFDVEDVHKLVKTYISFSKIDLKGQKSAPTSEGEVNVPDELVMQYALSMFVLTIRWWLTKATDYTPHEVAMVLVNLFQNVPLTKTNYS